MTEYIERNLEKEILRLLPKPQIIAILGPRRSGKTTLLLHLSKNLKKTQYLSFEDQKVLDLFDNDIEGFSKLYLKDKKFLIIDEFHYSQKGGKNLKYLFDFYPQKKIIISGSSSLEITIKTVKYLVGRIFVLELLPFSFDEYLRAKNQNLYQILLEEQEKIQRKRKLTISQQLAEKFNSYLIPYLLYGGYPEVVLESDSKIKTAFLNNIYNLFFLKEVKDLLGLIDDYKLKLLIKALSLQLGNILQYQELANISNFSSATLKKYLNFLEKTYISFFIKPFYTNKRTELTKNPKVYFFDLGFRNIVIDNFLSVDKRADLGFLLENFAAINFWQKYKTLNFWRTKAKAEVDFVLEKEGKIVPIEVKTNLESPKITASFLSFIKKYNPPVAYVFSLNFFNDIKVEKTKVHFLPIFLVGAIN